jgi:hypothetical protein
VSNKAELTSFRDMLVAIGENVAKLKRQGRSLDEIVASNPTAAFDAKWGQFIISRIRPDNPDQALTHIQAIGQQCENEAVLL